VTILLIQPGLWRITESKLNNCCNTCYVKENFKIHTERSCWTQQICWNVCRENE